ncbi:MFS transporter [Rhodobacteraceae bacterium S2214]|nr:MFS transporter [Rhodobacteraceae bacterium S2214]
MSQILIIWRDPVLRMIGAATMLFGVFAASFEPYKSLLGISVFGLSDAAYAVVLVASLAISVAAAIWVGIITDQRPSRKPMALLAGLGTVTGTGLGWIGDSQLAFVIAHVVLLPISATILGQLFAITRLYTADWPTAERDGVTSVIRALFAVPFVVVLPAWGIIFDWGVPLTALYPALFAVSLWFITLIWLRWPDDADAPWIEQKSGLGFLASVKELLAGRIVWPIFWMGAIHSGSTLMGVILALVFTQTDGRTTGDVGIFFGLFVALEIVVMLCVGMLAQRFRRLHIIAAGGVFYAIFMALLPVLAPYNTVWLLILPIAIGGGLLYGLSISYLQDLLGARAGAGSSLVALQRLVSEGLAAVIFAVGAAISGYTLAAFMGAAMIILGTIMLLYLDRAQRS